MSETMNPSLDLFKLENESVDMLLREMKRDPANVTLEESYISSPTKPLKFEYKDKDSSSDTYTSEVDDICIKPKIDDFSFATPMTSTINLLNPNEKKHDENNNENNDEKADKNHNDVDNTDTNELTKSPSKSALKKSTSLSPKKVAFIKSDPEIHHYQDNSESDVSIDSKKELLPGQNVETSWNELSSDDSTPPLPPSHTVSTFETLLNGNSNNTLDLPNPDSSMITDIKLKHDNFSNLSLNEKLDLFLNKDDGDNGYTNSMDLHLTNLELAAKENASSNINNLSATLLKQREITPREHLKSEIQRQLSGSSQSSLQSLRDSNRILPSVNTPVISQPLQFNDGIKGFPDELAKEIIPITHESPKKVDSLNRIDELRQVGENEKDNDDSFDRSYLSQSQSIMNLLNSASNLDLPSSNHDGPEIKQEDDNVFVKHEEQENVFIKHEEQANVFKQEITHSEFVKQEESNHVLKKEAISVKHESETYETALNQHHPQDFEHELGDPSKVDDINAVDCGQVQSVSDVGRSTSSLKLISTNIPKAEEITLTPKLFSNAKMEDDIEYTHDELSENSLRFHMDSDWKLEDSRDGDREDNDEFSNNDITISSVQVKPHTNFSSNTNKQSEQDEQNDSQEFEDASSEMKVKTLAPQRKEEKEVEAQEKDKNAENKEEDQGREDLNALANSSNIAPPEELTLPPIETNNYSSFEEVTRNLNDSANSYEELLSAEHDQEPFVAPDFLSIWRLQEKQKKHSNPRAQEYFKVIQRDDFKEVSQAKIPIPKSLQQKKFKEVNVMSRRVVSPDFEDIQISNFLPELSDDSGLDAHLQFLQKRDDSTTSNESSHSIDNKYILKDEDYRSHRLLADATSDKLRPLRPQTNSNLNMLTPRSLKFGNQANEKPKSRFKVPSFEIKRTNSILSPTRDKYNDIFEDTVKKPTIIGHGMKTLPSMDQNDVKRILSAKRAISQEEYSKLKLVGQKKNSVVNLPDEYNEQHASICESSTIDLNGTSEEEISHVAQQLMQTPNALLSTDQFFHDYDLFNREDSNTNNTASRVSSVIHKGSERNIEVAKEEPKKLMLDLPHLPMYVDYSTGNRVADDSEETIQEFSKDGTDTQEASKVIEEPLKESSKDVQETSKEIVNDVPVMPEDKANDSVNNSTGPIITEQDIPLTPVQSPKKKPIKIGSPMKMVRAGSSIKLESPKKNVNKTDEIRSGELVNHKLRDSPKKLKPENQSEHTPSVVSVPSVATESTGVENSSSPNHEYRAAVTDENPPAEELPDKGRLFFRIVGLKSMGLKDFRDRKAEFTISLDNGVHSIRTPPYKMNSYNVLIGKEFELTVNESLQFILTLKMKYDKPKGSLREVKESRVVKPKNKFSRMLGQRDIVTTTKFVPYDVQDTWENKFAQDGSFARCYIDLEQYQDSINGKIGTFNINCFNEWETILNKDKQRVKAKPYTIAQLEVKMLYVPRTDGFEVLPTSMRRAHESVEELRKESLCYKEGYMHQEGGDCEVWKRRFFKLNGTSLIAHSEFSHKSRAKINLSKVIDVIYVDKENVKNNNYRNFSDILLLEHSFKIKFANGEIIDFGAANHQEKVEWITLIENIIRRNKFRRQPWVKLMLNQSQDKKRAMV